MKEKKMEIRLPYGPARKVGVTCGPSLTRQSAKDECDINGILARYLRTGMLSHVSRRSPQYLDVSLQSDYRSALEQVRLTNEFFMGLPAKVRAHFRNDAAAFLDFMSDPANADEAVRLGLVEAPPKKKEEEKPPAAPETDAGGGGEKPPAAAPAPAGT